ncbi:MAG: hypothetical protein HRU04_24010 [Oceanospirillaceae bacterium]|nr:hypothetical protein [Oceanospirillaceae bacterium]
MMSTWYIVKQNWSATKQLCEGHIAGQFSGLGGDIWPIDSGDAQSKIDSRREFVDIGEESEIYVVSDFIVAELYYKLAKDKNLEPLFLELSRVGESNDVHGYDIGNPEGGYSIIESELLSCDECDECDELVDKYLNKKNGLFKSISLLNEFVGTLDTDCVEELSGYSIVGIRVVS